MCGRFPQALHANQYRRSVTPQLPRRRAPRQTRGSDDYRVTHNVAPNTMVPIVRCICDGEDVSESGVGVKQEEEDGEAASDLGLPPVIMQTMKWGLLPPHQKTLPGPGEALRTINARSDVLLGGSPLWSRPFNKGQRCVVFVQGFYEWLKRPRGGNPNNVDRIPHFVGCDEAGPGRTDRHGKEKKLMPLAGLWEKTTLQDETEPRYTFTIITTDVSKQLDFLHDRQPLILPDAKAIETWLNPHAPLAEVKKLVTVYNGPLEFYKVPKEVGKVGNDDPGFILPVEDRKDGLMAAFGRGSKAGKVAGNKEPAPAMIGKVEDTNSETNAPVKIESEDRSGAVTTLEELEEKGDSLAADELIDATKRVEDEHREHDEKQQSDPKPAKEESPAASANHDAKPAPSSRWSPDPFHPPVSPNRPSGGYSLDEDPQGGLTKYGSSGWKDESGGKGGSPTKKRVAMGDGALEKQFKKQKVKSEVQDEVEREAECAGAVEDDSSGGTNDGNGDECGSQSPKQHQQRQRSQTAQSPPGTPSTKASANRDHSPRSRHSRGSKSQAGGTDIRNFFAKSP